MVEIIAGDKGKGKTKVLMRKANDDIKLTNGNIVYLDKNNKHMYELSNRIRLINVPEYNIKTADMFIGFLYGIISQDHDLDKLFLDNLYSIGWLDDDTLEEGIEALQVISNKFEVDFIVCVAKDKSALSARLQEMVTVAL